MNCEQNKFMGLFSKYRLKQTIVAAMISPLCLIIACSDNSAKSPADEGNQKIQPVTTVSPLTGDRISANTWSFTQNSGQEVTEKFVLSPSEKYTYKFIQGNETPPPIDVLLIIDNSGSMEEEHKKLSEKLAFLLKEIKYTDWQINVITTDSPCEFNSSVLPLSPKTANYAEVFQNLIRSIPINGGEEAGLSMLMLHLQGQGRTGGNCTPKAWLRKNAPLIVIEVTDENERIYKDKPITAEEVIDGLAKLKFNLEENIKFFGLFYAPQFTAEQCFCATPEEGPNHTLAELVVKSRGTMGNICAVDYSQALSEISENASVFTRTSFSLGHIPAISTIQVDHNGVLVGGIDDEGGASNAWHVIDDLFIFHRPLAPEDELTIEYMLIDPRVYHLSQVPETGTLEVFTKKHKYTFDADISYKPTENSLYFFSSIEPGEEVSIKYQTPITLASEFAFPVAEKGIIQCFANDVEQKIRYLRSEGKIIFDTPPEAGAKIMCQYE